MGEDENIAVRVHVWQKLIEISIPSTKVFLSTFFLEKHFIVWRILLLQFINRNVISCCFDTPHDSNNNHNIFMQHKHVWLRIFYVCKFKKQNIFFPNFFRERWFNVFFLHNSLKLRHSYTSFEENKVLTITKHYVT